MGFFVFLHLRGLFSREFAGISAHVSSFSLVLLGHLLLQVWRSIRLEQLDVLLVNTGSTRSLLCLLDKTLFGVMDSSLLEMSIIILTPLG